MHPSCMILLFVLPATSLEVLVRSKREGGKVALRNRITPPRRLRKGETSQPPPGWKHCVHNLKATQKWRMISSAAFSNVLTTQFQCTWFLEPTMKKMKIQIAVQKLDLGNNGKSTTCAQFLEIIDHGKPQGRFCKRRMPQGDYITIGRRLRLDIQGDGALAQLVQEKKAPFMISYRSVLEHNLPGFRSQTTKPGDYDPHHIRTQVALRPSGGNSLNNIFGKDRKNTKKTKVTDKKTKTDSGSSTLSTEALVATVVCCSIVALLIIVIIAWRCCCVTYKRDHDAEIEEKAEAVHPQYEFDNAHHLHLPGYSMVIEEGPVTRNSSSQTDSSRNNCHRYKQGRKLIEGGEVNKAFVEWPTQIDNKHKKHYQEESRKTSPSARRKKKDSDHQRNRQNSADKDDRALRSRSHNHKSARQARHKESAQDIERPRIRPRKGHDKHHDQKDKIRRRRKSSKKSSGKVSRRKNDQQENVSRGKNSRRDKEKSKSTRRRRDTSTHKQRVS